jgi:hypothetical protein
MSASGGPALPFDARIETFMADGQIRWSSCDL